MIIIHERESRSPFMADTSMGSMERGDGVKRQGVSKFGSVKRGCITFCSQVQVFLPPRHVNNEHSLHCYTWSLEASTKPGSSLVQTQYIYCGKKPVHYQVFTGLLEHGLFTEAYI